MQPYKSSTMNMTSLNPETYTNLNGDNSPQPQPQQPQPQLRRSEYPSRLISTPQGIVQGSNHQPIREPMISPPPVQTSHNSTENFINIPIAPPKQDEFETKISQIEKNENLQQSESSRKWSIGIIVSGLLIIVAIVLFAIYSNSSTTSKPPSSSSLEQSGGFGLDGLGVEDMDLTQI